MTSGTKLGLLLAVALIAVVGGYFMFVPAGGTGDPTLVSAEPEVEVAEAAAPLLQLENRLAAADPPSRTLATPPSAGEQRGDGQRSRILSEAIDSLLGAQNESGESSIIGANQPAAIDAEARNSGPARGATQWPLLASGEEERIEDGGKELPPLRQAPPGDIRAGALGDVGESTPPVATVLYTVQSGDTLSSIALEWFGDARKWQLIQDANTGINPKRLQIGQKLNLPPKTGAPANPQPRSSDSGTYIVRSGDSLSSIARERLGSEARWIDIYHANRTVIGADPDTLEVGMKLQLPQS